MKLSNQQIISAVSGVAYCEEKENELVFHRFNKNLEKYYNENEPGFNEKLLATAGIALRFRTDSETLFLKVNIGMGSSRRFFAHDIFVNGRYVDSLKNFNEDEMTGDYSKKFDFPFGIHEGKFDLGKGDKEVKILFPSLAASSAVSIELDDGACFEASSKKKTYLAVGDSITHGYDALYPKNRYTSYVTDRFDVCEHNLAIGADVFRKDVAKLIEEDDIAFATVAYGTNDWKKYGLDNIKTECEGYLGILADKFPKAPIFVISPIWRYDCEEITECGEFGSIEKMLESICNKHENLYLVRGFDFVPHIHSLFGDLSLHPSDKGFVFYGENLTMEMEKILRTY